MQCEVIRKFPSGKYKIGQVVDSDDFPGYRGQQLINVRWIKPIIPDSDKCRVLKRFSSYSIGDEVNTSDWRNKKKLVELGMIAPIAEEKPTRKKTTRKKTRKRRKTNGK